jgi:hypothetical protein
MLDREEVDTVVRGEPLQEAKKTRTAAPRLRSEQKDTPAGPTGDPPTGSLELEQPEAEQAEAGNRDGEAKNA